MTQRTMSPTWSTSVLSMVLVVHPVFGSVTAWRSSVSAQETAAAAWNQYAAFADAGGSMVIGCAG